MMPILQAMATQRHRSSGGGGITLVGSEWGKLDTAALGSTTLPAHGITVGNDIIIATQARSTVSLPTAVTPSDTVNTFHLIVGVNFISTNTRLELWRATITTGGSQTITVTPNVSADITASAWEFNGLVPYGTSASDITASNTNTTLFPTVTSGATNFANELVFAAAGGPNPGQTLGSQAFTPSTSITVGSTWQSTGTSLANVLQAAWEIEGGSTGTQQYACTITNSPWAVVLATFKKA